MKILPHLRELQFAIPEGYCPICRRILTVRERAANRATCTHAYCEWRSRKILKAYLKGEKARKEAEDAGDRQRDT